jgi:flagellar motor switch protein FliN/FliY
MSEREDWMSDQPTSGDVPFEEVPPSDGEEANPDSWEDALAEQVENSASAQRVTPATYDRFERGDSVKSSSQEDINLDVILDVPVTLSMEIGRTRISIRNLLQLNQGSVVELDRLAGEPMDVMVNGTLIARGEVVVVNDKFGIRLTDIISPAERVRRLR